MQYTVTMFGYQRRNGKVRSGWLSVSVDADSDEQAVAEAKKYATGNNFTPSEMEKPEVVAKPVA